MIAVKVNFFTTKIYLYYNLQKKLGQRVKMNIECLSRPFLIRVFNGTIQWGLLSALNHDHLRKSFFSNPLPSGFLEFYLIKEQIVHHFHLNF